MSSGAQQCYGLRTKAVLALSLVLWDRMLQYQFVAGVVWVSNPFGFLPTPLGEVCVSQLCVWVYLRKQSDLASGYMSQKTH